MTVGPSSLLTRLSGGAVGAHTPVRWADPPPAWPVSERILASDL